MALIPLVGLTMAAEPPAEDCRFVQGADTPEDPSDDAGVCRARTYLQCDDAIGGKAHFGPPVGGSNATFTGEEPTESFTAGAGCGELENALGTGVTQDNVHDFTFQGFVDENIDSLTVELHDIYAGPERDTGEIELGVRVSIDSQSPFGYEEVVIADQTIQAPSMVRLTAEASPSSTGISETFRFTLTNLSELVDTVDPGFEPAWEREVKITIDSPDGGHVYVWGATEIPAGVTFNPVEDDPQGNVIDATSLQ